MRLTLAQESPRQPTILHQGEEDYSEGEYQTALDVVDAADRDRKRDGGHNNEGDGCGDGENATVAEDDEDDNVVVESGDYYDYESDDDVSVEDRHNHPQQRRAVDLD